MAMELQLVGDTVCTFYSKQLTACIFASCLVGWARPHESRMAVEKEWTKCVAIKSGYCVQAYNC